MTTTTTAAGLVTLGVLASLWTQSQASGGDEEAARRFERKLFEVAARGAEDPVSPAEFETRATQEETNAYLRLRAAAQLPEGVVDPRVDLLAGDRLTGHATVDLDAIRTERDRGWLDPAGYLTGRLPVSATGRLHATDGVGRLELERVVIAGVRVPLTLLEELVAVYSKTPDNPQGIDLDEPFALPYRIRVIRISSGEALVVQ